MHVTRPCLYYMMRTNAHSIWQRLNLIDTIMCINVQIFYKYILHLVYFSVWLIDEVFTTWIIHILLKPTEHNILIILFGMTCVSALNFVSLIFLSIQLHNLTPFLILSSQYKT
jgi:hypothetical protein